MHIGQRVEHQGRVYFIQRIGPDVVLFGQDVGFCHVHRNQIHVQKAEEKEIEGSPPTDPQESAQG